MFDSSGFSVSLGACKAKSSSGEEEVGGNEESTKKKVFIISGDYMGDIQGGLLAKELNRLWSEVPFRSNTKQEEQQLQLMGVGGARMRQYGVSMPRNQVSTDLVSSIGLLEALPQVYRGTKAMRQAKQRLLQEEPDVVVMIDYPGFNMPLLKWIKKKKKMQSQKTKVIYYIPPNEWLFLKGRASLVCSMCSLVLSVYPDEHEHYQEAAANENEGKCAKDDGTMAETTMDRVKYVGHPLVDYVDGMKLTKSQARTEVWKTRCSASRLPNVKGKGLGEESLVITLLPASRKQELKLVLPVMLQACSRVLEKLKEDQEDRGLNVCFIVSVARQEYLSKIEEQVLEANLQDRVVLFSGNSHVAIRAADVCVSKSGSCSLEVGLLNVPQVVTYRVGKVTAFVLRKVLRFKLKYVSLVNLILGRESIPELIQEGANPEDLAGEVWKLIGGQEGAKEAQMESYIELRQKLGSGGAVTRAAEQVLEML
jgi:lipid-A-disaccharide synthase